MLTNVDFALFAYCAYYKNDTFDHWFDGLQNEGICFGVTNLSDGSSVIAFEGSHDLFDWIHNFDCKTVNDPDLGNVCQGFMCGVRSAMDKILPLLDKTKPVYCVGHSRGGAQAIELGALLILRGYDVSIFAFEPPRTMHNSGHKLSDILSGKPVLITRNGEDIIPLMPIDYLHPREVTAIYADPFSFDIESKMKYHHMQLCIVALVLKEKSLS